MLGRGDLSGLFQEEFLIVSMSLILCISLPLKMLIELFGSKDGLTSVALVSNPKPTDVRGSVSLVIIWFL